MPNISNLDVVSGQGIATKAGEVATLAAGKPYTWNGKTTDGFDCSGFVSYVFKQLYPNCGSIFELDVAGFATSNLFTDVAETDKQAGDIVIFPKENGSPNHMGIVYDADSWIGSQSSTGTAKVKFSQNYWKSREKKFRRITRISCASLDAGRGISSSFGVA